MSRHRCSPGTLEAVVQCLSLIVVVWLCEIFTFWLFVCCVCVSFYHCAPSNTLSPHAHSTLNKHKQIVLRKHSHHFATWFGRFVFQCGIAQLGTQNGERHSTILGVHLPTRVCVSFGHANVFKWPLQFFNGFKRREWA